MPDDHDRFLPRRSTSGGAWRGLVMAGVALGWVGCRDGFAATLASVAPVHSHGGASAGAPSTPRGASSPGAVAGEVTRWAVDGASIRVLDATVAEDGPGAWRVRMAVDVTATGHAGVELRPSRFVVVVT
ncbi:MAG: hypothetical protein WCJ30_14105 [Deltaproteobacteria bacterium]